jgi:hypothetical protein
MPVSSLGFWHHVLQLLKANHCFSSFCLQLVLLVWHQHHAKPLQHVCQLHPLTSGHYRGDTEAGETAGQSATSTITISSSSSSVTQLGAACKPASLLACWLLLVLALFRCKVFHAVCCSTFVTTITWVGAQR